MANSLWVLDGDNLDDVGFEAGYKQTRRKIEDPSEQINLAQTAAPAQPDYTRLYGALSPDSQKLIANQLLDVERADMAAKQKFMNLNLNSGKQDDDEDGLGRAIGQAMIALLPIAGGYFLGGNRLAAAGAGIGAAASQNFEDVLKHNENMEAKKKAVEEKRLAAELEANAKDKKMLLDYAVDQQKRGEGIEDYVTRRLKAKQAGVGSGQGLSDLASAIGQLATKKAVGEAVPRTVGELDEIDDMLRYTDYAVQAIGNYKTKNPSAANENFSEAFVRNLLSSITNEEDAVMLQSALSLNRLGISNTLVKGTPSDPDQAIIDEVVAKGWAVPLPAAEKALKALGRRLLKTKEMKRNHLIRMKEDPDWYLKASPYESEVAPRFQEAPDFSRMSDREQLEYLEAIDRQNQGG